jgi:hypothetical protein
MSSSGSGSGSEFVTTSVTTDDNLGEAEVWATISTMGDACIYMLASGAGHASTLDAMGVGYRDSALRAVNGDTRGIVAALNWSIPGDNGQFPDDESTIVWGKRADGVKMGLQQLQVDFLMDHLWMDDGGGWEWIATVVKSSTRFSGKFGIAFEGDTATRLDDFGGGILHRDLGQIIRRWPPRG